MRHLIRVKTDEPQREGLKVNGVSVWLFNSERRTLNNKFTRDYGLVSYSSRALRLVASPDGVPLMSGDMSIEFHSDGPIKVTAPGWNIEHTTVRE